MTRLSGILSQTFRMDSCPLDRVALQVADKLIFQVSDARV